MKPSFWSDIHKIKLYLESLSIKHMNVEKAHELLRLGDNPVAFLNAQINIYSGDHPNIPGLTPINEVGLPTDTEFYHGISVGTVPEHVPATILPAVLNLGSGSDTKKQLPHAINVDISIEGRPGVVADIKHLPFADDSMTIIMASHVLEHIRPDDIDDVLKEWMRVLHGEGLLRIAVPDAIIVLNEVIQGTNNEGEPAVDLVNGSATLTQIYGLRGERTDIDPRWRHHILFSESLLQWYMHYNGLETTRGYENATALSAISGIKLDETNRYSLKMEGRGNYSPHHPESPISDQEYDEMIKSFTPSKDLSIIIPVYNEEDALPMFFANLTKVIKRAKLAQNEVIFVINGCTDNSEQLVREFISLTEIDAKITYSEAGILQAFIGGIENRDLDGHVAKIDVDSEMHPHSLGLMQMYLEQNPELLVTFADPQSADDTPDLYNLGEFFQEFKSRRNHIHGRMSMYRTNPFALFDKEQILDSGVVVEDMVLSSCYAYYFGLQSIQVTPHAIVRSQTPRSLDELVDQRVRIRRENKRLLEYFPQFKLLQLSLARITLPPNDDDDPKLANLKRAQQAFTQYLSHLARAVDPEGKGNHDWKLKKRVQFKQNE